MSTPVVTLSRIPRTIRNLQRFREIVGVLAKYGFEEVVVRMGLESAVLQVRRVMRERLRGERGQFAEVELVRPGEATVEEGGRVRLRRRRRLGRLGRAVGRRAAPGVGAIAVVGVREP